MVVLSSPEVTTNIQVPCAATTSTSPQTACTADTTDLRLMALLPSRLPCFHYASLDSASSSIYPPALLLPPAPHKFVSLAEVDELASTENERPMCPGVVYTSLSLRTLLSVSTCTSLLALAAALKFSDIDPCTEKKILFAA
jgi:hypothetical protein